MGSPSRDGVKGCKGDMGSPSRDGVKGCKGDTGATGPQGLRHLCQVGSNWKSRWK